MLLLSDLQLYLFPQMYAPTTLAPALDFCTLRYTTILEDGNLVVGSSSQLLAHQFYFSDIADTFSFTDL